MSLRGISRNAAISVLALVMGTLPARASSSFNNGTSYTLNTSSGNATIEDPETGDSIAQGSASDGAGDGFDENVALWVVFCLLVGAPMLLAGVRSGRMTSGVGFGLSVAVVIYAAIINTISESGIPDIAIVILTIAMFAIGFVAGLMSVEYRIGSTMLSAAGGVSVMMRIVLMRSGLLISAFTLDWIVIGLSGGIVLPLALLNERWGVILGSSAIGSFLCLLAVDLIINTQDGISRGLRFLFDRNSHHLADIITTGYTPPTSTIILLAISLAAIPFFALFQHFFFPNAFWRSHARDATFYDDASIRSKTWIGRIRGRTTPPFREEEKSSSQMQLLGSAAV